MHKPDDKERGVVGGVEQQSVLRGELHGGGEGGGRQEGVYNFLIFILMIIV